MICSYSMKIECNLNSIPGLIFTIQYKIKCLIGISCRPCITVKNINPTSSQTILLIYCIYICGLSKSCHVLFKMNSREQFTEVFQQGLVFYSLAALKNFATQEKYLQPLVHKKRTLISICKWQ